MKMCLTLTPTPEQVTDLWLRMRNLPRPVVMVDPATGAKSPSVSPQMLEEVANWMAQFEYPGSRVK